MVLAASDYFPVHFNMKRAVAFGLLFPPRSMNFLASTLTKAPLFEAASFSMLLPLSLPIVLLILIIKFHVGSR